MLRGVAGPRAALWYLHYPVLGLQACPLGGGVLVHGSDVLARPRALAVQVEAIAVGASADDAESGSQLRFHLLGETRDTALVSSTGRS